MSEDSNLPSTTRDSDAVDDGSHVSRSPCRRSGPETDRNQSESQMIASLETRLDQQNKDIRNLRDAIESLQNAYMERMDKAESELKKKDEEIKSLKKGLADKDNEIADLRKKVQSSEEITAQMIDVVAKGNQDDKGSKSVCFTARVAAAYQNIAAWAVIVFKTVETNAGNGYNSATGEFSAPRDGHYVFYSNILSQAGKNIETVIQVSGGSRQCIYSGGAPSFHGSGGNMLVVHLKAGDKVRVAKHGPWGTAPFYIHHHWSTFSGFLLE